MSALERHPDSRSHTGLSVEATASRAKSGRLALRFKVEGRMSMVALPERCRPERADGLWEHTCFEAFLRAADRPDYLEFNMAPSGLWAAYSFARTREGMKPALEVADIPINIESRDGALRLGALIDLSTVGDYAATPIWQVGLSAVIEDPTGAKSYWALRHPPGRPDFHHRDCFALELPAA